MTPQEARALVAALPEAREHWLTKTVEGVRARLLRGHGNQGTADLSESLDRIGRGRPRPHPDRDAFALAMLPLAAKFIARGANDKAASMAVMLGAPPDMAALDGLRAVFSSIKGHDKTRILVDRYLQVVEALTRH